MGNAKSGTREWAEVTKNIQLGCENGCLYCFAKATAIRFKRMGSYNWDHRPQARPFPRVTKFSGRVMFPSAHDITPLNVDRCEEFLRQLLDAGNQVIIVTKPRMACLTRLLKTLRPWRDQVLWRMTIGSFYESRLSFWEPGAPSFRERMDCLRAAHRLGWQTSVSMEPMLDLDPDKVISRVRAYVTESIWLGLMRNVRQRLALNCPCNVAAGIGAGKLVEAWTDERVRGLVNVYKNDPLIKWKDSIKTVIFKGV